jgi:23S rRNA 5-hydroxycytidine C2501 synthase
MIRRIELLAPARDASAGIAAIRCGADAVYMGAEKFGAREAAANTTEAIQQVTDFAHQYYAKVYVTLNTLLYDEELPAAEKMIEQLEKTGIDGLIIQDAGLLELDMPPLPMIASTQMNNDSPEKVRFLQDVGFSRAILARELTLDEIKRIRKATSIELECFIHGALCVGASGQCYMSYAIGGRSGNRGQCAQPCRRIYSVKDEQGKIIVRNRHLLSLKDLNLAEHLEELIDAGVSSFKIEGRLKDIPYVVNTVGYYRKLLDKIMTKKNLKQADENVASCHSERSEAESRNLLKTDFSASSRQVGTSVEMTSSDSSKIIFKRSSSGTVKLNFEPNLEKTFNRGFTDYGFTGRVSGIGSIDTPKSMGEFVGVVKDVGRNYFVLEMDSRFRGNDNKTNELHNADGICFFDNERNLSGTVINGVEGRKVYPQKMFGIRAGRKIYRNYDYQFVRKLTGKASQRKIGLAMILRETPKGFALAGKDEDGNEATVEIADDKQPALKKEPARQTTVTQLTKLGNTIFECSDVQMETQDDYFLPVSKLNSARRELVERLLKVRENNRPRASGNILKNDVEYHEKQLTYMGNVLNKKAEAFYRRHGVETIEPAAESGLDLAGRVVMTTKYCLRQELGLCPGINSKSSAESMILEDEDGREYKIEFRCGPCGMQICFGC